MNLGIRALLLIVAVILFVIGALVDDPTNWLMIGLACTAGALVVEELGINTRFGGPRR